MLHTVTKGDVMKIEVVPRFQIDGKYYTEEELPKEKIREIMRERLDLALTGIHYEKKKTA